MTTGTVKSVLDRGFGFIAPDNGAANEDLFFHRSAVAGDGFDRLREGQRVSFDQEADPRDRSRQRASNVAPLADDDAS